MKTLYLVFLVLFLCVMVLCTVLAGITGHMFYVVPALIAGAFAVYVTFAKI